MELPPALDGHVADTRVLFNPSVLDGSPVAAEEPNTQLSHYVVTLTLHMSFPPAAHPKGSYGGQRFYLPGFPGTARASQVCSVNISW